jgi:PIN domain nuclease of toxin-antitoxin system
MLGVLTDTHAVVWYLLRSPKLSATASARMHATVAAGTPLFVPTVCIVEIVYLVEKGRLPALARDRLARHLDLNDSDLRLVPLDRSVADTIERVPRDQVPDMPDRIIAASALHLGLPLVTRDGRIRASGIETIW